MMYLIRRDNNIIDSPLEKARQIRKETCFLRDKYGYIPYNEYELLYNKAKTLAQESDGVFRDFVYNVIIRDIYNLFYEAKND